MPASPQPLTPTPKHSATRHSAAVDVSSSKQMPMRSVAAATSVTTGCVNWAPLRRDKRPTSVGPLFKHRRQIPANIEELKMSNGYQQVSRDTAAAERGAVPDHPVDGYNSQRSVQRIRASGMTTRKAVPMSGSPTRAIISVSQKEITR